MINSENMLPDKNLNGVEDPEILEKKEDAKKRYVTQENDSKKVIHFDFEAYRKGLASELRDESDHDKRKELLEEIKTADNYPAARDAAIFKHNLFAKTKGLATPEKIDVLTSLVCDKANPDEKAEVMLNSLSEIIFELSQSDNESRQQELDVYLERSLEKRLRLIENIDFYLQYQDKLDRKLRDHQLRALIKIKDFIEKGYLKGFVAHPTGAGKTMLFTSLIRATEARTLIVVPSIPLVRQTLKELQKNLPSKKLTYMSSTKEKDIRGKKEEIDAEKGTHGDIVVTTYQSLRLDNEKIREDSFDLVVTDEAHNSYTSRTQHALRHFPSAIKLAFTATPDYYYTEQKPGFEEASVEGTKLYRNPEKSAIRYYPHEIDRISLKEAIESHMLTDLCAAIVRINIDLDQAKTGNTSHGMDFNEASLGEIFEKHWETLSDQVIKSFLDGIPSEDGKAENTLRFNDKQIFTVCSTKEQARKLAKKFIDNGISAACITGDTSDEVRNKLFQQYQDKEIQVLTSVYVLKEGWDAPEAEVCLMLRPTLSRTFYEQVIGRVLRLDSNNPDKVALVVDFLGKYTKMAPLTTPGMFGIEEFYNGQLIVPKKKEKQAEEKNHLQDSIGSETPYKVSTTLQRIEKVDQVTKISDDLVMSGGLFFASRSFIENKFYIRPDSLGRLLENKIVSSVKVSNTTFINAEEIIDNYLDYGSLAMNNKGYMSLKSISEQTRIQKSYLEAIAADAKNDIGRYEEAVGTNKVWLFETKPLWEAVKKKLTANLKNISEIKNDSIEQKVVEKLAKRKEEREQRDKSLVLTDHDLAKLNFTSPPDILRVLKHIANVGKYNGVKNLLEMIHVRNPLLEESEIYLEQIINRSDFRRKDIFISKECQRILDDMKKRAPR